jgi:hypothetical protein
MNLEIFEQYSSIASNFTVIVAMIGILVNVKQNFTSNKLATKDRFLSCTARYIKIQELLLSNEKLEHINLSIFGTNIPKETPENNNSFGRELALAGMMFQLMEDVWLMHDLDKNKNSDLYSGWNNLFNDWMKTNEIIEKWKIIRSHFSIGFINYVETKFVISK